MRAAGVGWWKAERTELGGVPEAGPTRTGGRGGRVRRPRAGGKAPVRVRRGSDGRQRQQAGTADRDEAAAARTVMDVR